MKKFFTLALSFFFVCSAGAMVTVCPQEQLRPYFAKKGWLGKFVLDSAMCSHLCGRTMSIEQLGLELFSSALYFTFCLNLSDFVVDGHIDLPSLSHACMQAARRPFMQERDALQNMVVFTSICQQLHTFTARFIDEEVTSGSAEIFGIARQLSDELKVSFSSSDIVPAKKKV